MQDSAKAHTDTTLAGGDDALPDHVVPEANRPGHHPTQEEDQPDLDAFAERLGLRQSDHDVASLPATQPAWPLVVIRAIAVGRTLIGAAGVLARPSWLESALGRSANDPLPRVLARMVGVRDLAIGVATLAASRQAPRRAARLAGLGALCDATDGIAASAATGLSRRVRQLTVPAAGAAAVLGAVAAAFVRDSATPERARGSRS